MLKRYLQVGDEGSERYELVQKVNAYWDSLIDAAFNPEDDEDVMDALDFKNMGIERENNQDDKQMEIKSERYEKLRDISEDFTYRPSLSSKELDDEYEIKFVTKIRRRYNFLARIQKVDLINMKIRKIETVLNQLRLIVILIRKKQSEYLNYYISDFSDCYSENNETIDEFLESVYLTRYNLTFKTYIKNILKSEYTHWTINDEDLKDLIKRSLLDYQLILEEILLDEGNEESVLDESAIAETWLKLNCPKIFDKLAALQSGSRPLLTRSDEGFNWNYSLALLVHMFKNYGCISKDITRYFKVNNKEINWGSFDTTSKRDTEVKKGLEIIEVIFNKQV